MGIFEELRKRKKKPDADKNSPLELQEKDLQAPDVEGVLTDIENVLRETARQRRCGCFSP